MLVESHGNIKKTSTVKHLGVSNTASQSIFRLMSDLRPALTGQDGVWACWRGSSSPPDHPPWSLRCAWARHQTPVKAAFHSATSPYKYINSCVFPVVKLSKQKLTNKHLNNHTILLTVPSIFPKWDRFRTTPVSSVLPSVTEWKWCWNTSLSPFQLKATNIWPVVAINVS